MFSRPCCRSYGILSAILRALTPWAERRERPWTEARGKVADLIGANASEIVFTSGGTEANNLAIQGIARVRKDRGHHIVTSAIEHHAVLRTCRVPRQGTALQ